MMGMRLNSILESSIFNEINNIISDNTKQKQILNSLGNNLKVIEVRLSGCSLIDKINFYVFLRIFVGRIKLLSEKFR